MKFFDFQSERRRGEVGGMVVADDRAGAMNRETKGSRAAMPRRKRDAGGTADAADSAANFETTGRARRRPVRKRDASGIAAFAEGAD